MVLYFSATGNTEYVAKQLATLLEDECLNLLERIRNRDHSAIFSEKPFVICSPVYVCELPRFLADYLRRVELSGNREVYFVFTSGGYTGVGGILAGRLMKKKGMIFKGYTELKMPRNYIANDTYPELSEKEIRRRIRNASAKIPAIAELIRTGKRLTYRHVWLFELIITVPFNPVWCRIRQSVKPFLVRDTCISCQKCAKLCPLNVIRMEDKKPIWTGSYCAHCMSCIQNCPVCAIEYGKITQKKKRYHFRKYGKDV